MSLPKNTWKWIGYIAATVIAIPILFVILVIVIMMIAQRSRTLYTITDKGYEFEVLYYPGGGAVGSSHELEVRVTGGEWDDEKLVRAVARDSAEVRFIDTSTVEVVLLMKDFGRSIEDCFYTRSDSATFDLGGPIEAEYFPGLR